MSFDSKLSFSLCTSTDVNRSPVLAADIPTLLTLEQEARKANPLTQAKFPLLAGKPDEQLGIFPYIHSTPTFRDLTTVQNTRPVS